MASYSPDMCRVTKRAHAHEDVVYERSGKITCRYCRCRLKVVQ